MDAQLILEVFTLLGTIYPEAITSRSFSFLFCFDVFSAQTNFLFF